MRDPVCEIAETLSAVHLRRYAVDIVESRGWQRRSSANVWILEIKRIFEWAENMLLLERAKKLLLT